MPKLAARLTDPTEHGMPLQPGPGSPNIVIGFLPAWRAVPAAAGQALQAAKQAEDTALAIVQHATEGAAATPGLPVAQAAEVTAETAAATAMASAIAAAAACGADVHNCAMPLLLSQPDPADPSAPPAPPVHLPGPPHGPGVVIDGSTTVMFNHLPACRVGDHVLESIGPLDPIALGCPTVQIGG